MKAVFTDRQGIRYEVDPIGKYPHVSAQTLINSIGIIPTFLNPEAENVIEEAVGSYGFSMGPMTGGTIEKDGTYKYPGDPDLYPLTRCVVKDVIVFIYPYGMTAFVDGDKTVMYRFD
ncbi:MAG: hypothetical protein DRO67_00030 [Candidatus Asgardarchaeum californiense]|nr:MAG: hypothetical protein DRO67_00030 [Candidatus Asgardarchaeum californiense]